MSDLDDSAQTAQAPTSVAPQVAAPPVQVPPPAWAAVPAWAVPPVPAKNAKRPLVALLLSVLFPGLGQVYNGQPAKAFVFFFTWMACLYATIQGDPLPWVFGISFSYLYGLVDAWRSAELINVKAAGGTGESDLEDATESPWWGISLVALGVLLLLNNLGWLRLADLERFWPLLLVAAGGLFIYGSLHKRRAKESSGETDPRA
jgi:TM2 domain-containing membrane protein YozV